MNRITLRNAIGAVAIVGAIAGVFAWRTYRAPALPEGVASGNGRIEAVEIDVATRTSGRIKEVLVDEGDFVSAGQVLARMDTAQLAAQKREGEAQLQRALIAVQSARSLVKQREAERAASAAKIQQRQAELDAALAKLDRSEKLAQTGNVSRQVLDDDRARAAGARAAVAAAEADAAADDAAIATAKTAIVDAEASGDAARSTIERVQADIDDSVLTSPRDGRIQYRVAQPGEVLAAGGRVLNLVDLGDVYMTFFLPTEQAGRVSYGADARIVLDAAPQYVIPARVSFVADVAQFTPKTVETAQERQKLMFRIKARIDPDLLRQHIRQVKTGLPGVTYVLTRRDLEWPDALKTKLPQ
ncbi:HlyD family efflux transporter periplasmic adaptor subunit [Chelatococcus sambhunathii]|uniref:HlyD family efflux transporter periplasmic adaptor subunit n=1 Tax=Chelatococcus sambhunathii TaxID=363953 RepID=A0ABU1DGV9_9HYPH|nr:HlyD family efflux transporter periplasmic adaptor subunit [Chelatococcus sambhunathii]MDR4307249.1 HlyD family efflux transporter periplasmic adaptor subunit [Chelatococcus sambhunathii]